MQRACNERAVRAPEGKQGGCRALQVVECGDTMNFKVSRPKKSLPRSIDHTAGYRRERCTMFNGTYSTM